MVITTIAATLNSVKTSIEFLGGLIDVRDNNNISLALQEIQNKLLSLTIATTDVAEKNAALIQELAAARQESMKLQHRLEEAEKKQANNAQYELTELAPGNWAYVLKPTLDGGKSIHYLCSACFNQGQHSILQEGRDKAVIYLQCPVCKNKYDSGRRVNMPAVSRRLA